MAAGFIDFEITWRADVFTGAPQASSAANYGTLGTNFRARKPRDEQERLEWLDSLGGRATCALPPAASAQSDTSDQT